MSLSLNSEYKKPEEYVGEMKDNKKHVKGKYRSSNGDLYEGDGCK